MTQTLSRRPVRRAAACGLGAPLRLGALPLLLMFGIAPASAAGPAFTADAITVEQPWSRATPGGATVAVGYLTIRNTGDQPDRLVSLSSTVAGRAGPHTMAMAGGVMTMRPVPGGIVVPPHGTVRLAPNGDHLMFEALAHPLKAGEHFPATLVFAKAGVLPVTFSVEGIGAKGPADAAAGRPDAMSGPDMKHP